MTSGPTEVYGPSVGPQIFLLPQRLPSGGLRNECSFKHFVSFIFPSRKLCVFFFVSMVQVQLM